jgi:hypothetical protein
MSILEIELTPEMEHRLREKAMRRGLESKVYAQSVVLRDLSQEEHITEQTEERQFNVMDFHGVGRDALKDLDVQKYVSDLRDEWD